MHEINVLTSWTTRAFFLGAKRKMLIISKKMGGYPDLNWELTVPHTAALPIELYPPFFVSIAERQEWK